MGDLISRQWLMECVNEGWIEFETGYMQAEFDFKKERMNNNDQ